MGSRLLEQRIAGQFVPFAAVGFFGLATIVLPPAPENGALVVAAIVLTVEIVLMGLLVPWSRLPRWTYVIPPLTYLLVVGLLTEAQGGPESGYAPLAALPVLWIALTLGRREVALGVAGVLALFILPVWVGGSEYSAAEWRRGFLWCIVALLIGFSTESLVRRTRTQAREAEARSVELAESERTLSTILRVIREADTSADGRTVVCDAALEVAQAGLATIVEPGEHPWLEVTAWAGFHEPPARISLSEAPSGSALVLTTGRRLFVPDVRENPHLAPRMAATAPWLVSALYEPIVRQGRTVGVLAVGWSERIESMDQRRAQAVRVLAAQAAVAIERADLLAQLNRLSLTDVLTGLPNRRAWEQELPKALARARRTETPLSAVMIDVDFFKRFNDTHGHLAGDAVLRDAATAWSRTLRTDDVLARYGGDEFAALLPDCDLDAAHTVAERLRLATPRGHTCSIGIACWDGHETGTELVERSDAALYKAKTSGRDIVEVTRVLAERTSRAS